MFSSEINLQQERYFTVFQFQHIPAWYKNESQYLRNIIFGLTFFMIIMNKDMDGYDTWRNSKIWL